MTTKGDIGRYYDVLTPLLEQLWGGNFHIGLWPDDTVADHPHDDGITAVVEAGDRLTDLLVGELRLHPGSTFLDVGCGIGGPALRLARTTGAHVTGITISTAQVGHATARFAAAGLADRACFRHADATALPFADRSYDAAWAIESLLHIRDTRRALTEISRVLKPGSPFVISDMVLLSPDPKRHEHSSIKPLPTLLALLDGTGFETIEVTRLDPHLRRSLQRLQDDLAHADHALRTAYGPEAVAALRRILHKTVPGIGSTYGYITVSARTRQPADQLPHA
ncbi:SAM-dependent methyltransferase [Streptomyces sp. TRM68416]|uniref:SAM-dependent methyltransferase n=1 Tax=Streptomyces sp. TRM68416 TaxID=2758412 RepID=UPI001661B673|nr:methyltransferase domain-containing protein [Streptomyces sp. TRM68416]MBD0844325.1 methyltransferase domain-containing protein [Streptomyces sp. TRM68416]